MSNSVSRPTGAWPKAGQLVLTARPYRSRGQLVDLPGECTRLAEAAGENTSSLLPSENIRARALLSIF